MFRTSALKDFLSLAGCKTSKPGWGSFPQPNMSMCVCVCAVVPKHGAPLWLKRWRSVRCTLCPRWMWKHARRDTGGLSHQLATWTSESTWRWYSISSAGFRHIAPSSPAACQTTGTPESHNPVKEGQAEYWAAFRFKEAKLSCSGG